MKDNKIYMTILNKKETELYIHEKYANELYQEDKILTDEAIEKIHLTSAGDKEVIDTLCKQYLHDPANKKEKTPNIFSSLFFQLKDEALSLVKFKGAIGRYILWVFGASVIIFAVFFNVFPSFAEYLKQTLGDMQQPTKEEMRLYKKYNIDLPENKKTKARGDKPPRLLSYDELTKEFPPLPPQPENEITTSTTNNTDNYGKSNETQDPDAEAATQIQSEKDNNSIGTSKKSSIVTDDGNNTESNEKTENLKKDINWLVSHHSDKYVLQLVSAIKKETIANYLGFFGDTKESIIEFTASINGQKRYILLYGPFDNRDLAYAQIEKLPQKARQIKPWVRTIKSIRELVE